MRAALAGFAGLFAVLCSAPIALAENKLRVSITRQPGVLYLVSHVMETRKLIEKQSAANGIEGVAVEWRTFSGGGAQTDALLSGGVDIVNTGTGNLLLLWDRAKGRVKGIVASSSQPLVMVSNDPRIRSLDDIAPDDKIAVPTIGISSQAILLQIAAVKRYGDRQARRFDANTVQLGHPDAVAAIFNAAHEVKNHFSAPPFQYVELKRPGVHKIIDSREILGAPMTQATFFTTTPFAEANPKIVKAVRTATETAIQFIKTDPKAAAQAYKEVSGDRIPLDELMAILHEPGFIDGFCIDPQGTMIIAAHLHKIGILKTMPTAWSDYYLPQSADLNGS